MATSNVCQGVGIRLRYDEAVLIAQITDTHIRPKGKLLHHMIHTARSLRRCVARLESLDPRPNIVIATGDLVDRGKTKEYRRLRKILSRLTVPLLAVPGNHDEREAFRAAFADGGYLPANGPLQYVIDTFPLRLIGLDSTAPKHPGGVFDRNRLEWFEAALAAAPRRPTFVFLHHPPFDVGIPLVDGRGFHNVDRFQAIVERNPQIVGIAGGHIHRRATARIGTTPVTTAPSTAPQVIVTQSALTGYGLRLEAPSFALHRWHGGVLETTVHTCDDRFDHALGLVGIANLDALRAG